MIDLFTNALFGIEDDDKKLLDSINLLKNAYASGVTTCVLAPPCVLHKKGDTERFLNQRTKTLEKLNQTNLEQTPTVILGAKVLMDHDLSLHKDIEKLCIGGGKYLLIELPNFARIPDFDEWIYNLNMKGIMPIIAHVERYPLWKDLINGLSSVKTYYQVNATALTSFFKRKVVKKLISARKKFFLSSETHGNEPRVIIPQIMLEKAKRYFPKNFSSFFLRDFDFYK